MIAKIFDKSVVVFGCGNILYGDDGFGPAVIKHLQENYPLPADVLVLDVGTSIRDILFDLVLSDLIMPGLDGTELIDRIKNEAPYIPAILFSGKIKVYEKDTRADVFLPKGMYAPAELLERIRLLLVRKRGPRRATPMVGAGVAAAL